MSNQVRILPPDFKLTLEGYGGDFTLTPPKTPTQWPAALTGNQWIFAQVTPTTAVSSFNPLAGTAVGIATTDVHMEADGFSSVNKAVFFHLTGKTKDSPSAGLLANTVICYAGSTEIGRFNVDLSSQKCGLSCFVAPSDDGGDSRFALAQDPANLSAALVEESDDVYTLTAHGLATGERVKLVSLSGGTGLTALNNYWFRRIDANTGTFHLTRAAAVAGTGIVNVTLDGTAVVLERAADICFEMTTVDPNLVIDFRLIGTDA